MLYTSPYPNLSEVPPELFVNTLVNESEAMRTMLAYIWNDETRYQGIEPRADDTPSRGQCGVSSLKLSRHLGAHAGDLVNISFVEGLTQSEGLNDELVWAEAVREGMPPLAVDITHDQYRTLQGQGLHVHVGPYEKAPENLGRYVAHERYSPWQVPRKKLLRRFGIMENRIRHLPPWRRMDTYLSRRMGDLGLGIPR